MLASGNKVAGSGRPGRLVIDANSKPSGHVAIVVREDAVRLEGNVGPEPRLGVRGAGQPSYTTLKGVAQRAERHRFGRRQCYFGP